MEKNIIGALPVGSTLQNGTYVIESVLGQGAAGITYLAGMQQKVSGSLGEITATVHVAIKEFFFKDECLREMGTQNVVVAHPDHATMVSRYRHSFQREVNKLSTLTHNNIVHVLNVFEEHNTIYYVMQYVSGGSIRDHLLSYGKMPVDKAVKYGSQIASALEYLHTKNMCHYDVKPGNIMLSGTDDAVLIDFGIAKNYDENGEETSTTPPGLTKGYAPLELYSSVATFSPKIDVYSLGATIYAMLTGNTPPEPATRLNDTMFNTLPAGVPAWLWTAVSQAMTLREKDRITMSQFLQMLTEGENYNARPYQPQQATPSEETQYANNVAPPPYGVPATGGQPSLVANNRAYQQPPTGGNPAMQPMPPAPGPAAYGDETVLENANGFGAPNVNQPPQGYAPGVPVQRPASKSSNKLLFIIISILAAALVGGGVFWLIKSQKKTSHEYETYRDYDDDEDADFEEENSRFRSGDEDAQDALRSEVEGFNADLPMTMSEGEVLKRVYVSNSTVYYEFEEDEDIWDVSKYDAETLKANITSNLQNGDDDTREMIDLCVRSNYGLTYKYIGDQTGTTCTIRFSVDELRDITR